MIKSWLDNRRLILGLALAAYLLPLYLLATPTSNRQIVLGKTSTSVEELLAMVENNLTAQMPSCNGGNICAISNFTPWRFGRDEPDAVGRATTANQHTNWFTRYTNSAQIVGAPINEGDLAHYRTIFEAQANADWATADREIDALSDLRLLGTALAMRYLDSRYQASFQELSDWLRLFRDLPQSESIYKQAQAKSHDANTVILPPSRGNAPTPAILAVDYTISRKLDKSADLAPSRHLGQGARALLHSIEIDLRRGYPSAALDKLGNDSDALLPATEKAAAYAGIAASYFYAGDIPSARSAAESAIANDSDGVPLAYWIGGLAAWGQKDYKQAAAYFITVAESRGLPLGDQAAADFWAGRALAADGDDAKAWFNRASAYPQTLYGLLALAELGRDSSDADWQGKSLTDAQRQILTGQSAGARALALIAIDEKNLAETELSPLARHRDPKVREAVLSLAASENLPSLAVEASGGMARSGHHGTDASYPIPHWQPQNGFTADPALIYALMRQESRFDPSAESPRGAVGLMQLMPDTARHLVSGKNGHGRTLLSRLIDPVFNITIGQHYLHSLSREPAIDHNLLLMIAAYNWGSNNLNRWMSETADSQDPLFFMESIPVQETRDFLENVLTGYGIYRLQLGRDLEPFAVLANGDWPRFKEETATTPSRATLTASLFTPRER